MTESKLIAQSKEIVSPGEVLAEGMDYLPGDGAYRLDDKVVANRLGLLIVDGNVLKTINMSGRYLPQEGDTVIGKVIDILMSGWRLDINSAYSSVLGLKDASNKYIERDEDLTKYFDLDDYVVVKITQVTTLNMVDVTCKGPNLRKLDGGLIEQVNPSKVPRIIGKRGSMVSLIKKHTGCDITVGQNGYIWVKGKPAMERIALQAMKKIAQNSHKSGLTDTIETYLKQATGDQS